MPSSGRTSEIHAKAAGRELAMARKAAGLTQHQLAARLAVNPSYVAAVETGRMNPTLGQLAHLANAVGAQMRVSFHVPERPTITLPDTPPERRNAAAR